MPALSEFPPHFFWGAATSSFQIEGSPLEDGAGPSNWYEFTHRPGTVANGDTGDVACDFYRRYESDVRLMKELGLNAFRFSTSWPRIIPNGRGSINQTGLDFYERLVDRLLENEIEPFLTLFHWDLPAWLEYRGGWLNRDVAGWFADYAVILYRKLGDRVKYWTTLNEPWVVTEMGYVKGTFPPAHKNLSEAPLAMHHQLLAHASAVEAYRAEGHQRIGIVVNLEPKYPATDRDQDVEAALRADAAMNLAYLDPVLKGSYPELLIELYGDRWPEIPEEDLYHIHRPVDFVGINYYTRSVVRHDPAEPLTAATAVRQKGALHTEMGWEVYPDALRDLLIRVHERYGDLPLFITENGAAFDDPDPEHGLVNDPLRVDYYRQHLQAALEAIEKGVPLQGYFAWSLFDNFEWNQGYAKRFGIVRVDLETQQRTPKASARFYSRVIETNGSFIGE